MWKATISLWKMWILMSSYHANDTRRLLTHCRQNVRNSIEMRLAKFYGRLVYPRRVILFIQSTLVIVDTFGTSFCNNVIAGCPQGKRWPYWVHVWTSKLWNVQKTPEICVFQFLSDFGGYINRWSSEGMVTKYIPAYDCLLCLPYKHTIFPRNNHKQGYKQCTRLRRVCLLV